LAQRDDPHIAGIASHEYHVAGFGCHIRSDADCDTDVPGHQRAGASLNTIADHRNALPLLLHVIDRLATDVARS
jgi:hypothetical protein